MGTPGLPKSFEVPFCFVFRCLDIISPLMSCAVLWTQAFAHNSISGLETRRGSDPFDTRAPGQEVLRCAVTWTFSWTTAQGGSHPFNRHRLRSSKPGSVCSPWPAWLVWHISFPWDGGGRWDWNYFPNFIPQIWARALTRPCPPDQTTPQLPSSYTGHWGSRL